MDKKKIKTVLISYMIVVAVILFFSETIRTFGYPNVEVGTIMSGRLIKQEELRGTLGGMNKETYYEVRTTKIDEVFVKPGEWVEKGQRIASYDVSELQEKLREKEMRYLKLENEIQITYLESEKKPNIEINDRDYTYELEKKQKEILDAKEVVALNERLLKEGLISERDYQQSLQQLADYEYAYEKLKEEEVIHRNKQEVKAYNEELEATINTLKKQSMIVDLQSLKKEIKVIKEQIKDKDILAKDAGLIEAIYINKRQTLTKDTQLYTLIKDKNLYQMKLDTTNDLTEVLQVGEDISIRTDTLLGTGKIKEVVNFGKESYIIIDEISFERDDASKTLIGQDAYVKISINLGTFNSIINSKAIRQEGSKSVVYVIEEERSAFGSTYVAKRIEVRPSKSNGDYTAVEGLTRDNQIIIDTDRALEDGSNVNVKQGG